MSQKDIQRAIRKLRLKDGDIVLCSDPDLIKTLGQTAIPGCPPCPIFYMPERTSIRMWPKSQIAELIADLQKYL